MSENTSKSIKAKVTKKQRGLIRRFKGYFGHVATPTHQSSLPDVIKQLKFSWRMMLDNEDISEDVHIEGLSILNELENTLL